MSTKTRFIAFSTQKGGAGKTTMTVLMASYLHYVKGYNVAVIDCDYPQYSIAEMRKRDLKMAMEDDHYKYMAYEQFTRLDKKAYPIVESNLKKAVAEAENLMERRELDFIFFDMPGTLNNHDLIPVLARIDYIVVPISADRVVLESALNYALTLKTHMLGKCSIKGIWLMWNMVDGREKTELYGVYEQVIAELGLDLLETFVPNSLRFRREQSENHRTVFRSTIFPADKSLLRGSNLDALTEELINLFK